MVLEDPGDADGPSSGLKRPFAAMQASVGRAGPEAKQTAQFTPLGTMIMDVQRELVRAHLPRQQAYDVPHCGWHAHH